jgi:RNA polymerase sigma factor (sigma-70 family)
LFKQLAFLKNIPNRDQSDGELVKRYQQTGDMAVLGELYQRYMDLLYGVCLKYLKEPETAKDAVMQIFEELVVKLKKHDVENVKSWLYTLAKNHCLMQLRTPRNLKTTEFKAELMQSEEDLHLNGVMTREANLDKMEKCLDTLPQDQKEAVQLFYLQGKCYNEIAESTGMDWNKVRSHIQNGRRNLKICMEKPESPISLNKIPDQL